MVLTRQEMIAAETCAFRDGASPEGLMEEAGRHLARMVRQFHPQPGTCRVFFGKGHNGGDVLVAARYLQEAGWFIRLDATYPDRELSPMAAKQLAKISGNGVARSATPLVVLDGLLGIGAQGDPRWPVVEAIEKINRLRVLHAAWVLAADLPSGLNADTGVPGSPCVRADATLAIGAVKVGLVADTATAFVGRLAVARLSGVSIPSPTDRAEVAHPTTLRGILPPRGFEIHKGQCGRVSILAGHRGTTGAAALCAAGAVAAGAGLVTLWVPEAIYSIVAAIVLPEVMVRPIAHVSEVLNETAEVLAIGPGLGENCSGEVVEILRSATIPCVVDAAALRALSPHLDILKESPGPRLLTPHPGEMEQLVPQAGRSRREWAYDFCKEVPAVLLLKGARTVICERGSNPVFNSTGHPGMASGGMGDVLTGVCTALIAQRQSPRHAAVLGAWVCGRAAEIAISSGESQESLRACHVISHLGAAFTSLRVGDY